jgi:E3 ubiquitin-protein ligase UBR7
MVQCIACEVCKYPEGVPLHVRKSLKLRVQDWFHESCMNLRERPLPREPTDPAPEPTSSTQENTSTPDGMQSTSTTSSGSSPEVLSSAAAVAQELEGEAPDSDSEDDDDLPPALIPGSAYESFMCGVCVARCPPIRRYVGTSGTMIVVRDTSAAADAWPYVALGYQPEDGEQENDELDVEDSNESGEVKVGTKRARSPHSDAKHTDATKRMRASTPGAPSGSRNPTCLAPSPIPRVQELLDAVLAADSTGPEAKANLDSTGDVFLTEGWRERWCRCSDVRLLPLISHLALTGSNFRQCLPDLERFPYLLAEEDTYEPPEDPEASLSLEELGMRALNKIPRDRAIDGMIAFQDMRFAPLSPLFLF